MLRHRSGIFLRRLSSVKFDPLQWASRPEFDPTSQKGISRFLADYEYLTHAQKDEIKTIGLPTTYSANLKFYETLANDDPEASFAFVVDHIVSRGDEILGNQLIEKLVLRLLFEENLNAAVSLMHTLLRIDRKAYCFSNQLWSSLASKACELCHYPAASLVYHEIIDPITAYDDPRFEGLYNWSVPFLLFPDLLARIAVVLTQNGDYVAVLGIQQYFKRFYSYFWHRTVYRDIALAKVEAYASAGLFSEALSEYVNLAWQHRGHMGLQKGDIVAHNLKHAVVLNSKERLKVVSKLENPQNDKHFEYNKYTISGKGFNAIFDGILNVADTPKFNNLILNNVLQLVQDRNSATERLVSFITSKHHALIRPVVSALCGRGLVFEAWAVILQTKASLPRLSEKVFFRGEDIFILIFKAIREKLSKEDLSKSDLKQLSDILKTCRNICQDIAGSHWSYESRLSYLRALLVFPSTSRGDLRLFLNDWTADYQSLQGVDLSKSLRFSLEQKDYEKLVAFNLGDDILSTAIPNTDS